MADYFLSPVFNEATFNDDGAPGSGWTLTTYLAGTTTPATVYKDNLGSASHTNPIVLNTRGEPPAPIWIVSPQSIKFVLEDSLGVTIRTIDDVSGVNDAVDLSVDEWQDFLGTPTYISATQFSLTGDQTSQFQVGRRLKTTNTGGTVYSRITASAFAAGVTTVTVVNDAGALDSGLSLVSVGALTATGGSIPGVILTAGAFAFQLPALFNAPVTINGAAPLVFEGATADAFETSLAVTDPTADRTITLADANFTVNAVGAGVVGLTGTGQLGGATKFAFQARQYRFRNAAGVSMALYDTSTVTVDTSTAGPAANGRDQAGAFANGAQVHVYAIWNESTLRGIISLAAPTTGPTLPTGYTWWCYVGTYVLVAGGVNFPICDQAGPRIFYRGIAYAVLGTALDNVSEQQVSTATVNLYVPTNALDFTALVIASSAFSGAGQAAFRVGAISGNYSIQAVYGGAATGNPSAALTGVLPYLAAAVFWIRATLSGTQTSPIGAIYVTSYTVPQGD